MPRVLEPGRRNSMYALLMDVVVTVPLITNYDMFNVHDLLTTKLVIITSAKVLYMVLFVIYHHYEYM